MTEPGDTIKPAATRQSLVIFLPDLSGGGAERLHIHLASALAAQGYDVTFLLHRRVGVLLDLLPPHIRLVTLNCRRSLAALMPLVRFLRRERPDFFIANLGHNNIVALWAAALARVPARMIVTEHNSLSRDCAERSKADWRYKILPLLYRLFLCRANGIVAVSSGVANDLTATAGIPRHRITVIENPVIDGDFDRRMAEPAAHPWLAAGEPPFFLGAGRLIAAKDFTTLIAAFAITARRSDARLILLGEGPMHDALAAQARKAGIEDRVSMPGYQLNPLPFMRAAAALVLSSRHEGFGNVLVEALGCGTQIVSTDCPFGPSEILAEGKFGRMVPSGDPQAMAEAMLAVLEQPAFDRAMLRERARAFSVARAAAQYIRLFDTLRTSAAAETDRSCGPEPGRPDIIMTGQFPEDSSLIKGGVQASTYGLARALAAGGNNNIQVLALPLKPGGATAVRTVDGIKAVFLHAPCQFLASSIVHLPAAMRRIIRRANPVLHLHGTGLFQAVLCILARRRGIPLVWTLHGITEKETLMQLRARWSVANLGRYLFYRNLERLLLRAAPDIIVDTPYVQAALPPVRRKVHVVPQGIFMAELTPLRGMVKDPSLALSVGVMAPRKGHHRLLDAFALVRRERPEARLMIAGALAVPKYYAALQARAAQPDLAGAVSFGVNLPRAEILQLLGRARLFALHSEEESQGIALCEALAAGLPAVATRIGGIPHVVTEGGDGFLTGYGDIEGFAAAILRLFGDDELHGRMAAHGIRSSARFSWDNIAAEVAAIYRAAQIRLP